MSEQEVADLRRDVRRLVEHATGAQLQAAAEALTLSPNRCVVAAGYMSKDDPALVGELVEDGPVCLVLLKAYGVVRVPRSEVTR